MKFRLEQIDHIALNVRDVARSTAWYQEVLGLERRFAEHWPMPVALGAGSTWLALFAAADNEPLPSKGKIGFRHLAFRVSRDNFEKAQIELRSRGIPFEFEDHGIAHSIYFRDPDGHELELTTYELKAKPGE
ncbi:MAG: VOC family protein [Verrucomicrobiota bacterium]|jgi:catechol 2,3-dioxygenase-like lactoylglutathione lyase family enzyme